jgi:hypothetical protein
VKLEQVCTYAITDLSSSEVRSLYALLDEITHAVNDHTTITAIRDQFTLSTEDWINLNTLRIELASRVSR